MYEKSEEENNFSIEESSKEDKEEENISQNSEEVMRIAKLSPIIQSHARRIKGKLEAP